MEKWKRVLLLIAIPFSLVQVAGLYIDWAYPRTHDAFVSSFAMQDLPRLIVYWVGGFVSLLLGVTIFRRQRVMAGGLQIGGVYLMLLGANGGWWSTEHIAERLCAASATLFVILFIAAVGSGRMSAASSTSQ